MTNIKLGGVNLAEMTKYQTDKFCFNIREMTFVLTPVLFNKF